LDKLRVSTLIISIIFLLGMSVATTGCLDNGILTGTIEVKYESLFVGEVAIYLDDGDVEERLGEIQADEWATFEGIDPGEYTISARSLGEVLDSEEITVNRGETTRVELSYY